MSDERRDFFVSYTRADRAWAEWIAWQLEENGYTVFVQAWDFGAGSNFVHEMQRAAAKAQRTIAVLSPDYLTSKFTQPEWYAAFAQDPTGEKRLLIPVRVRECSLEGLLPQIVYVDLVGLDVAAAGQRLLAGVREGRGKPTKAPVFPGLGPRTIKPQPRFPGEPPAVWTVPHLRNLNFTGREDLLEELEKQLQTGGPIVVTQAITGMGGIGKTQLVVEYAYRHVDRYGAVLWVEAEQPAALAGAFARLATALNLPVPAEGDHAQAAEAVRKWLARERDWLLVFDSASGPQSLAEYLPRLGAGHVVITSQHPHWTGTARSVSLPLLPLPEAMELLCRTAGWGEEPAAEDLAKELGRLPLALAQAGGYIRSTGISLPEYLDLFRARRRDLWQQEQAPGDYRKTVAASLSLSLEKLSEPAADLLRLCAFLAPDAVPRSLLVAFAGDVLKLNPALQELASYSLLELTPESASMHRLLQAVVRDQLSTEQQTSWAKFAVTLVRATFRMKEHDPHTWRPSGLLLPHALAAVEHAERAEMAPEACGSLLNEAALYLRVQGEFFKARELLQKSVGIDEKAYAANHPMLGIAYSNLATVERELGNVAEARTLLRSAIVIGEEAHGADHPTLAISYSNLALVERDLGNFAEAQTLLQRAIAIGEKTHTTDHPTLAVSYSNLGLVEKALGNLVEARTLLQQAIAIDEKAYAADHPTLAVRYSNLATVERELGNLTEARTLLGRAIAIGEKAYAADHPTLAIGYSNLATIEQDLGNLAEAWILLRRAIAIDEKAYGADHPKLAVSYSNLATVEQDLGNLADARTLLRRAIAIDEKAYVDDHPILGIRYNNLAHVEHALGNAVEALALMRRAHSILARKFGAEHPHTRASASWLAENDPEWKG